MELIRARHFNVVARRGCRSFAVIIPDLRSRVTAIIVSRIAIAAASVASVVMSRFVGMNTRLSRENRILRNGLVESKPINATSNAEEREKKRLKNYINIMDKLFVEIKIQSKKYKDTYRERGKLK